MFKFKEIKQSLSLVIANSFSLLKCSWAPNIGFVVIGIVAIIILGYLFRLSDFATLAHSLTMMSSAQRAGSATVDMSFISAGATSHVVPMIGLGLILWVVKIINGMLVRSSWNTGEKGSASFGEAFVIGLKYFYVYLAVFVVLVIVMAVMVLIQYLFSLIGLHWLNSIVGILTQLFFYYIAIKLLLVEAVAVVEDCGLKAFARSWCYISGNWWRTLATVVFAPTFYLTVIYLCGVALASVIFLPGVTSTYATFAHMVAQPANWFTIIMKIVLVVSAVVMIFTMPTMMSSTQATLLNDLKRRKEG